MLDALFLIFKISLAIFTFSLVLVFNYQGTRVEAILFFFKLFEFLFSISSCFSCGIVDRIVYEIVALCKGKKISMLERCLYAMKDYNSLVP